MICQQQQQQQQRRSKHQCFCRGRWTLHFSTVRICSTPWLRRRMQFLPSSCIKEPPRDSSSFSVPVSRWVRNGRIDLRPWIRNDWSSPGKGKCLLCNNLGTRSLGRLHFYASALALIAILWASGGPRASDGFQGWPFHRVFFFFFPFFSLHLDWFLFVYPK